MEWARSSVPIEGGGMRIGLASIAVVCCLAAIGGIAYFHGFERAMGREEWQYRPALIRAYSDEVVFRAGPCMLLAVAAVLAACFRVLPGVVAAFAILGSALSAAGTYFTIRQYILERPGGFMPTTVWDGISLILWLAATVAVLIFAIIGIKRSWRSLSRRCT
jgi:hypothetical protein